MIGGRRRRYYISAYYIGNFISIYGIIVINLKKNVVVEDQLKMYVRQCRRNDIT